MGDSNAATENGKRDYKNVEVKDGGKNLGSVAGGRMKKARRRRFQDEIVYLKTLCAPYRHDKTMPWKYVIYPAFKRRYGDRRTKAALVAKWKMRNDQDFEDEERTELE